MKRSPRHLAEVPANGQFDGDGGNRTHAIVPPSAYPEIDPAFGHWLSGFVDGEGCFIVAVRQTAGVSFHIVLRADDYLVLEDIARQTGLGTIIGLAAARSARTDGRPRRDNPTVRWSVVRKRDCQRLVEIFDHYPLRAKKARDFEIWRRAVREHALIRPHAPGADYRPLTALAAEMQRIRQYDSEAQGDLDALCQPADEQLTLGGAA